MDSVVQRDRGNVITRSKFQGIVSIVSNSQSVHRILLAFSRFATEWPPRGRFSVLMRFSLDVFHNKIFITTTTSHSSSWDGDVVVVDELETIKAKHFYFPCLPLNDKDDDDEDKAGSCWVRVSPDFCLSRQTLGSELNRQRRRNYVQLLWNIVSAWECVVTWFNFMFSGIL